MVHQASKREVNGVSILRHGTIKQVVNLLTQGHPVSHDLHVMRGLVGSNVSQDPVVVASPQVLEGLSGFV